MRGGDGAAGNVARWTLAALMVFTGTVHFVRTSSFFAQLPSWIPARSAVIWASGAVEIALGLALALSPARWRATVGRALAVLFVLVFPANVYQAIAARMRSAWSRRPPAGSGCSSSPCWCYGRYGRAGPGPAGASRPRARR